MKILVYIICYNDHTEAEAKRRFRGQSWGRILRIDSTPYLESEVYNSHLLSLQREWLDADYVGTLAWRAHDKTEINMEKIKGVLQDAQPDVFAFLLGTMQMLSQATTFHPNFGHNWLQLLSRMCYDERDCMHPDIPFFACNYWLARPRWMRAYISFFQNAKMIIDNPRLPLHLEMWKDAKYSTSLMSPSRCLEVFGVPYFPFHPFVCERLPCFFFWFYRAKVLTPNKVLPSRLLS